LSDELRGRSAAEARIDRSLTEIQARLGAEDWAGVEEIVSRLPGLLQSLPAADSATILVTVRSCLDAVRIQVESSSRAIGKQLSSLKQGRIATEAYRASDRLPDY
jgi:hypothetical protein